MVLTYHQPAPAATVEAVRDTADVKTAEQAKLKAEEEVKKAEEAKLQAGKEPNQTEGAKVESAIGNTKSAADVVKELTGLELGDILSKVSREV